MTSLDPTARASVRVGTRLTAEVSTDVLARRELARSRVNLLCTILMSIE